jgi:threonine dehydrogenase-like Zn-dependent dehydrogenase
MRATVFHGIEDVRVDDVPDTGLREATDAVVRVTRAAICGSDLWFYRGIAGWEPGWRLGHEFLGVVEEAGSEVRSVQKGDLVIAPFSYSDGTCEFCSHGLQTACDHGGFWGGGVNDGGQAEAVRVPLADGTLVRLPEGIRGDAGLLAKLLPLTDVVPTGHYAALCAQIGPGSTAAVIGDGAVGLCAVLAAKRLGAERIIAVGHHESRLALARGFGATDVVDSNDPEAAAKILEMTCGGAQVVEAVGNEGSFGLALEIARKGSTVGFVGMPFGVKLDAVSLFLRSIRLAGGPAPARQFIPELVDAVIAGTLDPSPLLDSHVTLDQVPDAYRAMHTREALKVLVAVSE